MEEREAAEMETELRQLLREAGLDPVVDEVDATIVEGKSVVEKRKIDTAGPSDELVAIDYTATERYELLLEAVRRALVEPAAFEASAEARLVAAAGAASISFVDPEGNAVRTLGEPESEQLRGRVRSGNRIDRQAAADIAALLAQLDPRINDAATR